VDRFYALADLFVLPSHSEGSPNALLEAMAAGLPIVATSVGGVPEIITSGVDGLLVPAGRPPAIASALSTVLANRALRSSVAANARRTIGLRHTTEARVRLLIEIYAGLLGCTRGIETKVA
jgi:glycosyltransferase involved in cell wall biosynthesis